jgi:hypothetical protein
MSGSPEFSAFSQLFLELDGSSHEHRMAATLACVEALFDRALNPPMLNGENPTLDDVDGAEAALVQMIRAEANRARELIRSR